MIINMNVISEALTEAPMSVRGGLPTSPGPTGPRRTAPSEKGKNWSAAREHWSAARGHADSHRPVVTTDFSPGEVETYIYIYIYIYTYVYIYIYIYNT